MELGEIIRYVREAMSATQEEFAGKIGVGRLEVTRWENNKATPNRIAQRRIYDVVKEEGIPLFDKLVSDFPKHEISDKKVILYHSSREGIRGEIRPISRDECDFGKGFYMGTSVGQALTIISNSEKAMMYVTELNTEGLNVLHIPTEIDWAMLVAYSRGILKRNKAMKHHERYKKMIDGYDVIAGKIADDRIFYVLNRFFQGTVTDTGLIKSMSSLDLGDQYVAVTEKACGNIRILRQQKISDLERACIYDVSKENRIKGIEFANEICKARRRDGRFFDEILRES